VNGSLFLGRIWNRLLYFLRELTYGCKRGERDGAHQLLKYTLVQLPLFRSAVKELLVISLQALPVVAELAKTLVVDVLDTATPSVMRAVTQRPRGVIHARRTPRDLPAFLHAVQLTAAVRLGLAHHVVIVVGLAARPDEKGGTEKGRRAGTELSDLGDVVG
jgi:hypothetical protein